MQRNRSYGWSVDFPLPLSKKTVFSPFVNLFQRSHLSMSLLFDFSFEWVVTFHYFSLIVSYVKYLPGINFYLYESHDFTFLRKLSFNLRYYTNDHCMIGKPLTPLPRLIDEDMEAQRNSAYLCNKLLSWIWTHICLGSKLMFFLSQYTAFSLNAFSKVSEAFFFKKLFSVLCSS